MSTGFGLASGVLGFSVSTVFSPTFWASGTMSGRWVGRGAGFSCITAFLSPCNVCATASIGTMSTETDSTSAVGSAAGADSVSRPKASAAACKITDVVRPVLIFRLLILFLQ